MTFHERADDTIVTDHDRRVDGTLASPSKELYLITRAENNGLVAIGGSAYHRRIIRFFVRQSVESIASPYHAAGSAPWRSRRQGWW